MGHQHQLFDDPFASSISSLEADIFSGPGGHQQWPGLDLDGIPAGPAANNAGTSSGGYGSPGGDGSHRKINHNAYERDRRKQLNGLYSSLRSLLPDTDHTKKLSIPITVTKALKYIPELQKQLEGLEKKKEELTRANCKPGVLGMRENAVPVVSATCLDDRDIMVQVSLLSSMAGALPMSKCIKVLENEGLRLVSSSTSAFQNRAFYSLHLQPISEMPPPPVEYDLELEELEQWEAAALVATIEAFERQSLQELHKWRHVEEPDREEMQKRRRVEELKQQLQQEAAARRAAANARKN